MLNSKYNMQGFYTLHYIRQITTETYEKIIDPKTVFIKFPHCS